MAEKPTVADYEAMKAELAELREKTAEQATRLGEMERAADGRQIIKLPNGELFYQSTDPTKEYSRPDTVPPDNSPKRTNQSNDLANVLTALLHSQGTQPV